MVMRIIPLLTRRNSGSILTSQQQEKAYCRCREQTGRNARCVNERKPGQLAAETLQILREALACKYAGHAKILKGVKYDEKENTRSFSSNDGSRRNVRFRRQSL